MWKKLLKKLYIKGDGSRVQYLLPGIVRLSKNKRLKKKILQNTKTEFPTLC